MGRIPLPPGAARSNRVECKITPAEHAALTAMRGKKTESQALREALLVWCLQSDDRTIDEHIIALVEEAVERGFMRAMRRNKSPELENPLAREERAAVLSALIDQRLEMLASKLEMSIPKIRAIVKARPGAPALNVEQRAYLGLAP